MPWLVLHPLLPLVLLAGIGAQALWQARGVAGRQGRRWRWRGLAASLPSTSRFGLSYFRSADARELLVQVQTSDDVPGIRDELMRLEACRA